jgi:hypothetical protein
MQLMRNLNCSSFEAGAMAKADLRLDNSGYGEELWKTLEIMVRRVFEVDRRMKW